MSALIYNGTRIGERNEMLSLTDCWRASGESEHKRPAQWERKEGAPFIAFIAERLNVPVGHIWGSEQGRHGGTWAHWQIAMAYAMYLSPEFHAWCNEVVRAHMEGRLRGSVAAVVTDQSASMRELLAEVMVPVHTEIKEIKGIVVSFGERLPQRIQRPSKEDERILYQVAHLAYRNKCPIDQTTRITDDKGNKLPGKAELDHFHGHQYNAIWTLWPVSLASHVKLTSDYSFRKAHTDAFNRFHIVRETLISLGKITPRKPSPKSKYATIHQPGQPSFFSDDIG